MTELNYDTVYEITQEDFEHAIRDNCRACLFAQCIKRYYPNNEVYCAYVSDDETEDGSRGYIHLKGTSYMLNNFLTNKMSLFDFGYDDADDNAEYFVGIKFKLTENKEVVEVND